MKSYIIEGGRKLEGECLVSGSKNASLPIIAASILNKGVTKLYNVPNIKDTQKMLEILQKLGCKIKQSSGKIVIDSKNIKKYEIPENLMRQMRSSVIIAGALISRFGKAIFSYPGGCDIGARPIDLHLKAFEKIGVNIKEQEGDIYCTSEDLTPSEIQLDFPSVGATENIILASVFIKGKTIIKNAAMEPEIIDLQNFLNRMGARISGAGSNVIEINGVSNLKDVSYKVMPDRIEAGTFLCMCAATGGKVFLKKCCPEHLTPVIHKLEETGCNIKIESTSILLEAPKKLKSVDIKTLPYPGFPTDMQSIFSAMLCLAKGNSIITENIFENRFKFMSELKRMGAKITTEGRTAVIKGVKRLSGTTVRATDLRGGAALVLAGLTAKKTTKIENIEYILRGYENLEKKLSDLGAKIIIKEGE